MYWQNKFVKRGIMTMRRRMFKSQKRENTANLTFVKVWKESLNNDKIKMRAKLTVTRYMLCVVK
ncbi:hypothetical protein SAMN04515674_118123 [Pseudarcicella hirudinis]|uniref:Uncharacterized protein n=1 Tax=Pseudarcicella hirudinis TaxID=1079859 RepID=A0A1I5YGI4_9BACT|nr:hypothetical protein SAMN04515674_118123 [Pseudarcicella hirudinis]